MTKITCNVGDAPRPKGELPVLRLGAPFQLDLKPAEQRSIDIGLTFDVPVLIVEFEGAQRQGVQVVNAGNIVPAGQPIIAFLESKVPVGAQNIAMFERGDTLLQVVPLTAGDDVLELKA